ncbi:50S ribosomal protein L4 [Caldiplasma sukawensis]
MEVNVYDLNGQVKGKVNSPKVFASPVREDIIKKAFRIISLSNRHPYGSSPLAGTRRVGHTSRPGMGISRMPRVAGSSRAVELGNTKGGRSALSPRSDKILSLHINKKEKRIAWKSAMALSADPERVKKRGHRFSGQLSFPIVVDDSVVNIGKTREAEVFLKNLGVWEDIERAKEGTKIRAGRGKMRNRKYRTPKSILIVTHSTENRRVFTSLPGVDVANVKNVSISKLAPGGVPGRLVIYTESSLKNLEEESQ